MPGAPDEWTTSADDPVWSGAPWLDSLRPVPVDSVWPRLMTAPHPRAVATLGPEFAAWTAERAGVELRWWQSLVAHRLLEIDEAGEFVWLVLLLSTSRQVGKSHLLRELALWRLHQSERFGEQQLVIHIGNTLPTCREVQRSARAWARSHRHLGYDARDTNGQEEVSAPDGSRWMIRGNESVYGYSASMPMVDEAWNVPAPAVDDGLEPTMLEREQPQLLLTSTAHRRATALYPSRRAGAIDQLREPDDVLMVEWSAWADADLDDEEAWRAASPHWHPRRRKLLASKLARALKGEGDVDSADDDPVEAFRGQYLNVWAPPGARLRGRDEPLVGADVWESLADVTASPAGGPVVVAVEDFFGLGAATACAAWCEDGQRVIVWGALYPSRSMALTRAAEEMADRPGSQLLAGGSLAAWAQANVGSLVEVEPVGTAQTRSSLPTLRDLVARRVLVHDGSPAILAQGRDALVVQGASGLALSPRCPRSDLIRAASWAAQRVVTEVPAQPFRVL